MHKFSAVELISNKLFLAQINFRNSTEWIYCRGHHTSEVHLAGFGPLCLNGHKGFRYILLLIHIKYSNAMIILY